MSRYSPTNSDNQRPKKRSRKTIALLLSCCLFLLIICGCLLAALILIGKHVVLNTSGNVGQKINKIPATTLSKKFVARLPNDTKPLVYDLTLLPNLNTGLYAGWVNITLNLTNSRDNIVLHGANLTITQVELSRNGDLNADHWKVINIIDVKESAFDELLFINVNNTLSAGIYNLFIRFNGSLLNKLRGFYQSTYKAESGRKRQIATSKFEPTYARQAFPCFDEPNLKAIYKVHLLKPKDDDYIALSNFPALEGSEDYNNGEGEIISFQSPEIPMSTYLSCFIVSDFKSTSYAFNNGPSGSDINNGISLVPFKVYASPDQLSKTTYAGEVGQKIMEFYVQYFGLPYPLPKLDMVAIPDFVSGAMEHWGLVTYRETALLYTNTTHSSSNKQRVATVVAHELAHSWFGNLVTMDWWNDLWLNEGFATYIEYKGAQQAEPDWGMLDQFLISELHSVLITDSKLSSHPIIQTVLTPDEITEVFDSISYNKGAAILRMLEATVGEDVFKSGVTKYLTKYMYSNAVTDNFWAEVQEAVGSTDYLDVKAFMDTWTVQMGYPVLSVTVNGDLYTLTQKRYLLDSEATFDESESEYKYKWTIPVTFRTDAGISDDIYYFNYTQDSLTITKPQDAKWIKFNNDQIGYYRVNYPIAQWNELIENYSEFNVSDRTHLIEETFSLAEAGQLDYTVPLNLTKKLENELDYVPWSVAYSMLSTIKSYLSNSEQEATFKEYVRNIVTPAYTNLSWDENIVDESSEHLQILARVTVLTLACSVDLQDCLDEAKSRFDNWIESTDEELSQNLRSLIYKYGMFNANTETWEKMFQRFASESDANEKLKLMNGLANVQSPTLLTKLIKLAEDETYVRSQDYFTLLQYIAANTVGTPIVWDYVRENWLALVERFTLNNRYLGNLIPAITSTFATTTKYEEMEAFFAKYPDAGAGAAARKRALETVENNIKWVSKYRTSVEDWVVSTASSI